MRLTAHLAALIVASVIISNSNLTASAQADTDNTTPTNNLSQSIELALDKKTSIDELIEQSASVDEAKEEPAAAAEEPAERLHSVAEGENLSKIAKQYGITWRRIWDKNTGLENPDIVKVGEKLTIPANDEDLVSRPVPEPVVVEPVAPAPQPTRNSRSSTTVAPAAPALARTSAPAPTPVASAPRGASSGNLYAPGYCTWYVKNRRPDLPNNLGNADTWVARARAQGLPTGSTPRVGAVGQQGMHVVYIEKVLSDGNVTVSEMNWRGLYVTSTRTVPASNFMYIY
jgi:surface antigen